MKLKELIKDIEVLSTNAAPDTEISGISYDSRLTRPGDLFVAIKGFETDGHRYIPKAMEKGAAVVLCEDIPADGTPYVQTADCRFGLAMASREFFGNPASEMKMIGFTGTSGKTSSTYIMKHLLEAELDAKVGLIGTNGNMIGDEFLHSEHTTPESYELHKLFREMADAGCTHVVMEVSSHSLTLERVAGIMFDVAVFTNLSQDHLDLHGTMDEYAAAKKKIFSQCRMGCVNADDERAPFMLEGAKCPMLTYSAAGGDAKLKAEATARDRCEQLIFQAGNAKNLSKDDKVRVAEAVKNAKRAVKSKDAAQMNEAAGQLETLLNEVGVHIDPNAEYHGSASYENPNNDFSDDAVDADFEKL